MPGSPVRVSPLDVVKANHGGDFGWFIERDGVAIGQLTDERVADRFWSSYTLEPLGDTDEQRRGCLGRCSERSRQRSRARRSSSSVRSHSMSPRSVSGRPRPSGVAAASSTSAAAR